MRKIDITIGSKMTINTGNYSSIQPTVSITAKDVEVDRAQEIKTHLDNMCSIFMVEEIKELSGTMDTIKKHGLREVLEKYEDPELLKNMKNSLRESIDVII